MTGLGIRSTRTSLGNQEKDEGAKGTAASLLDSGQWTLSSLSGFLGPDSGAKILLL